MTRFADVWAEFERQSVPLAAAPDVRMTLRGMYYAGALGMMKLLVLETPAFSGSITNPSERAALEVVLALQMEFEEFYRDLLKEKPTIQ